MYQDSYYTAGEALTEAGIDMEEGGFWNREIRIGSIQVTSPEQRFYVGVSESLLIKIGNQYKKLVLLPKE